MDTVEHDHASGHDVKETPLTVFRYVASTILLIFSIVIVVALIFTGNTRVAQEASPAVALVVCILAVMWLSLIEGQQASIVGLPPVDPELYKDSHPLTFKNARLAFKGDNMDRYLMGRQFMVLLVVFTINQCAGPLDPTVDVLGLPDGVKLVFLDIGLGMIIFTCILGQLTTQVIASHCMLDYINNYFALFTLYVALAVEFSGIMHCAYLIQYVLSYASGKPIITNGATRTGLRYIFFWTRVLMSLAILCFSFAVVFGALFSGQTMMTVKYPNLPNGVNVFLFFFFMMVVGMLEGMQIAFYAVSKLPPEERGTTFFGKRTSDLLFRENGQNLPAFMIGRQLAVVCSFFLVASIEGLNAESIEEEGNIFGVSDGAQRFLDFGFHGTVVAAVLASITWKLAASAFPVAFLNFPPTYFLLLASLFLEFTGLCAGAWVLGEVVRKLAGLQYDEVYIGTPEEGRANRRASGPGGTGGDEGAGGPGEDGFVGQQIAWTKYVPDSPPRSPLARESDDPVESVA